MRRVLVAIPLILIIIIVNFALIHMAPGDPVLILVGEQGTTPEYIEMMREKFGLNKPLHEQLIDYVSRVLRGDLGYSLIYRDSVLTLIVSRIPATVLLVGTSLVFSAILGVIFGVESARRRHTFFDKLITIISLLGYSMPLFWLGLLLMLLFSFYLRILPAGGMVSPLIETFGIDYVIDLIRHLILPAFVMGMYQFALLTRMVRSSMSEVLEEDFIKTARLKGLEERTVVYKHGLRNSMRPIITVLGYNLGLTFAGAVMTETVFAWPGLGRLLYNAVGNRDYPIIMGMFIIISITVIFACIIADLVYALVDPQVRYN